MFYKHFQALDKQFLVLEKVLLFQVLIDALEHEIFAVDGGKVFHHNLEQLASFILHLFNGAQLGSLCFYLLHPFLEEYLTNVTEQTHCCFVGDESLCKNIVVALVKLQAKFKGQFPIMLIDQHAVYVVCPLLESAPIHSIFGDEEDLLVLGVVAAAHDRVRVALDVLALLVLQVTLVYGLGFQLYLANGRAYHFLGSFLELLPLLMQVDGPIDLPAVEGDEDAAVDELHVVYTSWLLNHEIIGNSLDL